MSEPVVVSRGARRRWLIAGAVLVALAAFVLVWFQPQKLVIDESVSDPTPGGQGQPGGASASDSADNAGDNTADDEPEVLGMGDFVSLDHGTSGVVRVLELADGARIVRLEGLDSENGPDLFLYLSTNTVDGDEGAFDDDFFNLGRLKGNKGDQSYDLPADVDLARFKSVVIWCDRFNSAFGAAALGTP